MRLSVGQLLSVIGLFYIPSVDAWAFYFWKQESTEGGIHRYGTKIFRPPDRCYKLPEGLSQPFGISITQYGYRDLLGAKPRYHSNTEWLDPVRYVGFWYAGRSFCEGLPAMIIRFHPDLYTKQSFGFRKLQELAGWINNDEDVTFRSWGEIPFGDEYFQDQLRPGDVAILSSSPQPPGSPIFQAEYLVFRNALTVEVTRGVRGQRLKKWQHSGTVTATREVELTFPPNKTREVQITGQDGDREREIELGMVPRVHQPEPDTEYLLTEEPEPTVSNTDQQILDSHNAEIQRLQAQLYRAEKQQQIAFDRQEQKLRGRYNQDTNPSYSRPASSNKGTKINPGEPKANQFSSEHTNTFEASQSDRSKSPVSQNGQSRSVSPVPKSNQSQMQGLNISPIPATSNYGSIRNNVPATSQSMNVPKYPPFQAPQQNSYKQPTYNNPQYQSQGPPRPLLFQSPSYMQQQQQYNQQPQFGPQSAAQFPPQQQATFLTAEQQQQLIQMGWQPPAQQMGYNTNINPLINYMSALNQQVGKYIASGQNMQQLIQNQMFFLQQQQPQNSLGSVAFDNGINFSDQQTQTTTMVPQQQDQSRPAPQPQVKSENPREQQQIIQQESVGAQSEPASRPILEAPDDSVNSLKSGNSGNQFNIPSSDRSVARAKKTGKPPAKKPSGLTSNLSSVREMYDAQRQATSGTQNRGPQPDFQSQLPQNNLNTQTQSINSQTDAGGPGAEPMKHTVDRARELMDERTKLERQFKIEKSRKTRLESTESGLETEQVANGGQAEIIGERLQGGFVEEEAEVIEDSPNIMIKQDPYYDPDIFIIDPVRYAIELKQEEEARLKREAQAIEIEVEEEGNSFKEE